MIVHALSTYYIMIVYVVVAVLSSTANWCVFDGKLPVNALQHTRSIYLRPAYNVVRLFGCGLRTGHRILIINRNVSLVLCPRGNNSFLRFFRFNKSNCGTRPRIIIRIRERLLRFSTSDYYSVPTAIILPSSIPPAVGGLHRRLLCRALAPNCE